MNPENVNPSNFSVESILFNNDDFSIAYGVWTDNGTKNIAMRWNGAINDAGYPKAFGYPMWFLITEELQLPILRSLIGLPSSDNEQVLKAIAERL